MTGTFAMPDGGKLRTTTKRRYALARYMTWRGVADWFAVGYTDNLLSARKRVSRTSGAVILDTETGEIVR